MPKPGAGPFPARGLRPARSRARAVAFGAGPVQDTAKIGALFSCAAAALAIMVGKLTRVRKRVL
jgi:hypothetical protein